MTLPSSLFFTVTSDGFFVINSLMIFKSTFAIIAIINAEHPS